MPFHKYLFFFFTFYCSWSRFIIRFYYIFNKLLCQYKYYHQTILLFHIVENHISFFVLYSISFLFYFFFPFFNYIYFIFNFIVSHLFQKSPSIQFSSGFKAFKASACFINWSSIDFICFSNVLTSREYLNW